MDLSKLPAEASSPGATIDSTTPNGVKDVFADILEWSKDRPGWQRDALRRLLTAGGVLPTDIQELTELCKSAHGLDEPRTAVPLQQEHLAIKGQQAATVSITSVTHHCGVNALATEQTVAFGPNLTIVYGPNAAGKSGYARILKRACRSRGVENILGNVLSNDPPLKPKATIRYGEGSAQVPLEWTPETPASEALAHVSVFDGQSAPVYLRDKTDVAFRPYGLDIFDKLSVICGDVRTRLQEEQDKLNKAVPILPRLPEGTRAKVQVDGLTSLTKAEDVHTLATLSPEDTRRLKELRDRQRDFQSSDPKQRSRELKLKAERLNMLARHLEQLSSALGETRMAELRKASDDVRIARESLALLQKTALTPDLLPGTGGDAWRKMWEAVGGFSQVAQSGAAVPGLTQGSRCPFCQQTIGAEAATRLKHFAEYVSSEAQAALKRAETKFTGVLSEIRGTVVERSDTTLAVSEVAADDADLAQRIKTFLGESVRLQDAVKEGAEDPASFPATGVGTGPVTELRVAATAIQSRAAQLETAGTVFDPALSAELRELEARVALADGLAVILEEIERKKRLAAYRQCIDDTSTQPITRKSTELTKELVTDQLRNTFQDELTKSRIQTSCRRDSDGRWGEGSSLPSPCVYNRAEHLSSRCSKRGRIKDFVLGRVPDRAQHRTFSVCNHL